MGSVVAEAGVNPADQRWSFWPLLPISVIPHCLGNWAELCATKSDCITDQLSREITVDGIKQTDRQNHEKFHDHLRMIKQLYKCLESNRDEPQY